MLVVVNGVKVFDKKFPRNENTPCLKRLEGNLVLQKFLTAETKWSQNQGRVTNVNAFSGLMAEDRMKSRTSGEDWHKPFF